MLPIHPFDWESMIALPAVRAAAEALQRRWPIWVGLVARSGQAYPIAGSGGPPAMAVCAYFKRRADAQGGCAASLMAWSAAGRGSASCHAHLSAVIVPLEVDGLPPAALYASGFLPAGAQRYGDAAAPTAGVADLLQRAQALGLPRNELAGLVPDVPRLGEPERLAISCLLESMADTIRAHLAASSEAALRQGPHDYSHIVGHSPELLGLFSIIDRIAAHDSTVLIHGENGTGKELIARAIHATSRRRERPFVTQNCSALNDNLLESELFGHVRGAFTGAIADKRGLFDMADGGTLFLDEIGDMSPTMQVKLLRVLQEGTFLPVGDTIQHSVDVRIIAASNRSLRTMVGQGRFREDLFYRLNVIALEVPPLRARRSDIPLLCEHFLAELARRTRTPRKQLAPATFERLMAWDWPGNVRELRHEIERLVVLSGAAPVIEPSLLAPRIAAAEAGRGAAPAEPPSADLPTAVEALERRMISAALAEYQGNKTQAARRLGISRRNLIRKVQSYRLESPSGPRSGG